MRSAPISIPAGQRFTNLLGFGFHRCSPHRHAIDLTQFAEASEGDGSRTECILRYRGSFSIQFLLGASQLRNHVLIIKPSETSVMDHSTHCLS